MSVTELTIDHWIAGHARFNPDKPVIHFQNTTLTYRQFADRIDRTARVLAQMKKLKRGDRIALYAMNRPEHFILLFAAARLGLLLVPLNWRLAIPELRFILRDCGPKLLFVDKHFGGKAEEVIQELPACRIVSIETADGKFDTLQMLQDKADKSEPPDETAESASPGDPLLIVYTSGTTGTPKGAVLTQAAMQCNAAMAQHAYDMTSQDHILNVLPLFHVGGLAIQPLPGFSLGATLTLHEKFDAALAVETIERFGVTLINTVPTMLQAMLRTEEWKSADLSSLRAISIGSTDVPVPLIEQVHERGIPLIQIYGATETGPIAIYQRIERAFDTVGSIGRAGLHCRVQLVDAAGKDVADGENGEIWVKGNNCLTEYWNNPQATETQLTDGWFHTGDVAHRDADGNYWFADRLKHVIISGGENIHAAEVERVLRTIPGIREVSVVGRADEKWGEVPVAVLALEDPSLGDDAILSVCSRELARYKQPKAIVRTEALPRNAMGKILVDQVKELAARA